MRHQWPVRHRRQSCRPKGSCVLHLPAHRLVRLCPYPHVKQTADITIHSYAPCLDATTYVYASEIWPTHLRAKGCAISTSGLYAGSLIVLTAAPKAFSEIGWKYYACFLVATVLSIFLFQFYFIEVSQTPFMSNEIIPNTPFYRLRGCHWRRLHRDLATKLRTF